MFWTLLKRLTWLYLILIACLLVFLLVIPQQKEKTEYRLWREQFEDIENVPERFLKCDDSPSAQVLKKLAQPIGIDLGRGSDDSDLHPTEREELRFKSLSGPEGILAKYLKTQLEKSDQGIDEFPRELSEYLQSYEKPLEVIKHHILSNKDIHWKTDFIMRYDSGPNSPGPNLSGLISLEMVLVADALKGLKAGQSQKAERCIEAVWKLNQSLRQRSEFLVRVAAQIIDRYQFGTLRKMERPSSVWMSRMEEPDYRREILSTRGTEVFIMTKWANEGNLFPKKNFLTKNMRWYQRYCVVDYSQKMREQILKCLKVDLCSLDSQSFNDFSHSLARWNLIGSFSWDNPEHILGRVAKLMIDRELTSKILQIKNGPISTDTDTLPCDMCGNLRWKLQAHSDSELRIGLEGKLTYEKNDTLDLPLDYDLYTTLVSRE